MTSAGGGLLEGSHNVPAVTNCHAECDSQFAQNTALCLAPALMSRYNCETQGQTTGGGKGNLC